MYVHIYWKLYYVNIYFLQLCQTENSNCEPRTLQHQVRLYYVKFGLYLLSEQNMYMYVEKQAFFTRWRSSYSA